MVVSAPLLLSFRDLRQIAGISRSAAYRMHAAGRLPLIKIGRRTVIRRADLERIIAEAPPADAPKEVAPEPAKPKRRLRTRRASQAA